MQPYAGSVNLSVFGINGLTGISTAGSSGGIYLGAKTRDTPANINLEINRPILTNTFFGLGILGPRPNNRLTAGLNVESGVDLGKFFWGGAVSGQVTIGGSMDTFYCGACSPATRAASSDSSRRSPTTSSSTATSTS
jgi:hypothetical protein